MERSSASSLDMSLLLLSKILKLILNLSLTRKEFKASLIFHSIKIF